MVRFVVRRGGGADRVVGGAWFLPAVFSDSEPVRSGVLVSRCSPFRRWDCFLASLGLVTIAMV